MLGRRDASGLMSDNPLQRAQSQQQNWQRAKWQLGQTASQASDAWNANSNARICRSGLVRGCCLRYCKRSLAGSHANAVELGKRAACFTGS